MTDSNPTRARRKNSLVAKLDEFAADLMANCKDMPIQQRVDIFKEVARWVGIKNRLDEGDQMGEGLHGYRSKLATGPAAPEVEPHRDRREGGTFQRDAARAGGVARWGVSTDTADDYGGSALDAIKSKLPRPDPQRDERDRDDPGSQDDDAGRSDWGLRPGVGGGS